MSEQAVEELEQVETTEDTTTSNDEVTPEVTEAPAEDSATGEIQTEEPAPSKKGKGVQKRINQLTRDKHEAQEKVRALERQLADKPHVAVSEPKVDDYPTYEEYEKASLNSKVDRAVDERLKANKEADTANAEEIRRRDVIANYNANVEAYAEGVDDFYEVTADMPEMNEAITEAVIESDKSAPLHYYLGNNPEVLTKLSKLSPMSVAREIGKLEVLLEKPPATKKVTTAPDPIAPVGANNSRSGLSDKQSTDDWMRERGEAVRNKRR